jgi:hypothetical protein
MESVQALAASILLWASAESSRGGILEITIFSGFLSLAASISDFMSVEKESTEKAAFAQSLVPTQHTTRLKSRPIDEMASLASLSLPPGLHMTIVYKHYNH